MKIPFDVKEFDNNGKKSFKLSLSFATIPSLHNEIDIKKLYFFIKKIDKNINETILDQKSNLGLPKKIKYAKTLKRSSPDYPYYMNVSLPYDEKYGFHFRIYNEDANESDIKIITRDSVVSLILELTDLKFTDVGFRANWSVIQIRKFKPYSQVQEFFMSGCYICDDDNPHDLAYQKLLNKNNIMEQPQNINQFNTPYPLPFIPPPPPPHPHQHNPHQHNPHPHNPHNAHNAHYTHIPKPPPGPKREGYVPSMQELSNAIKILRKTTPKKNDKLNNSNNSEDNNKKKI